MFCPLFHGTIIICVQSAFAMVLVPDVYVVPPKMTAFAFGDHVPEAGETISVQCTVSSGDVPVEFSWTFNGKSTSDLANVFVSKTGRRVSSLTVESLTEKNVGNYSCLARNKAGEAAHTAALHVNGN